MAQTELWQRLNSLQVFKKAALQSQLFKVTKILAHKQLTETFNKKIWIVQILSQADTSGFFSPLM